MFVSGTEDTFSHTIVRDECLQRNERGGFSFDFPPREYKKQWQYPAGTQLHLYSLDERQNVLAYIY